MTDTTCTGPECTRPAHCKGLCRAHYQQARKWGRDKLAPLRPWGGRRGGCVVDGCDRPLHGTRYCQQHQRHARAGNPLVPIGEYHLVTRANREPRRCEFPDCGREHYSGGICVAHYQQRKRGRELTPIRARREHTTCYGPDCTRLGNRGDGLCEAHYRQIYEGRPLAPLTKRRPAGQAPKPRPTTPRKPRAKATPKPRTKATEHPSNLPPGWFKPTLHKRRRDPLEQPRDTTDRTMHVDFNVPELPRDLRRKAARRARLMGAADLIPMLGLEDVA